MQPSPLLFIVGFWLFLVLFFNSVYLYFGKGCDSLNSVFLPFLWGGDGEGRVTVKLSDGSG